MSELHMLKERKGKAVTTRCLLTVEPQDSTVWWQDVTCLDCLEYGHNEKKP